jgi:hypothetical protein
VATTYPAVYRARAVKYEPPVVTAYVPQIFGQTAIEIIDSIGTPAPGMGWVFFQGGNPEFPVWTSGIGGVVTEEAPPPEPPAPPPLPVGGGSEEVYIGANAPGEGFELWYDTDADAPLTVDQRWNTAWGAVAVGSVVVGNPLALTANALTLATSNINFTMLTGRRYRIVMGIRAMRSLSTETFMSVLLRDFTTSLFATDCLHRVPPSTTYTDFHYEWNFTGDGVARVFNVALRPANVNCEMYTDTQGSFYIEDLGPTVMSPAPAPVDWGPYDARYAQEVDWSANVVCTAVNNPFVLGTGGAFYAHYQRVGQWCDYTLFVLFGTGVNGGTGALTFNLPFPASSTPTIGEQLGTCKLYAPLAGGNFTGFCWVSAGTSILRPYFPISRTDTIQGPFTGSTHPPAAGTGTPQIAGQFTVHNSGNLNIHIRYKVA